MCAYKVKDDSPLGQCIAYFTIPPIHFQAHKVLYNHKLCCCACNMAQSLGLARGHALLQEHLNVLGRAAALPIVRQRTAMMRLVIASVEQRVDG